MPRQARLVLPDYPYHIVQRGNYRSNIFDEDIDKLFYLKHLHRYRKECSVKLYGWCLMDNHVHLLLEPKTNDSFQGLFRRLNVKYSHYIHRKRGVKGRLWEDRYYSSCLDPEHFAYALKYVELNPFRAGMEKSIGEYIWTSYQERMKRVDYRLLNDLPSLPDADWHSFIFSGLKDEEEFNNLRKRTARNIPSGRERFIKELEGKSGLKFQREIR